MKCIDHMPVPMEIAPPVNQYALFRRWLEALIVPDARYVLEDIEDIAAVVVPHGLNGGFTTGKRQLLCREWVVQLPSFCEVV